MSKVLLLGYHPPPMQSGCKLEAANYRTWQFLEPLLQDGNEVCLCADSSGVVGDVVVPARWTGSLRYQPIAFGRRGWRNKLQRTHDDFQPDCVVAVNFTPCLYATKLRTDRPVWMDMYGDLLTVIQAACFRARSDRGLLTSIGFLRNALRKGDAFSVCGTPQHHMLVGELAMVGRLNWRTFGYSFVHAVLPGAPEVTAGPTLSNERTVLSRSGVHRGDFVVLWCGGYNQWTDVDTLFGGLEWAMARDARVHYVSVGANTYEAPDNVYTRFQQMVDKSRYRDRIHLLGWQPWSDIPTFYRESDVGLNIDALHYETIYGTRTRLVEMIAYGLPVITSEGSELSYLLRDSGAALSFPIGDCEKLGQQILTLCLDNNRLMAMRVASEKCATGPMSFLATTQAVRDWVKQPELAPDRKAQPSESWTKTLEHRARAVLRHVLWQTVDCDK